MNGILSMLDGNPRRLSEVSLQNSYAGHGTYVAPWRSIFPKRALPEPDTPTPFLYGSLPDDISAVCENAVENKELSVLFAAVSKVYEKGDTKPQTFTKAIILLGGRLATTDDLYLHETARLRIYMRKHDWTVTSV